MLHMTNHDHLLVETPAGQLARGMRQLNGVYTQRFNRAHHRVGRVYQGRYKAILVQKEQHLLALARYIVLNPVRAGTWCAPPRRGAGVATAPPPGSPSRHRGSGRNG